MVSTILGRKLGMTQIWDENDNVVPVTVIQAGPCTVSQVKTKATDGYDAVQIGFGDISAKHVNKPMAGHFKAAGVEPMRYLREVRVENGEEHKTGDVVTVADFAGAYSHRADHGRSSVHGIKWRILQCSCRELGVDGRFDA